MKLVQFEDGTYGITRWTLLSGRQFKDLKHGFWWSKTSDHFLTDCRTTSRAIAEKIFQQLRGRYKVIEAEHG